MSAALPRKLPRGDRLSQSDHSDFEWFYGAAQAERSVSPASGIADALARALPLGGARTEAVYSGKNVIGHRDIEYMPTSETRSFEQHEPEVFGNGKSDRYKRVEETLALLPPVRAADRLEHETVFSIYFGNRGNLWDQLAIDGGRSMKPKGGSLGTLADVVEDKDHNWNAAFASHGRVGALYLCTPGGALLLEWLRNQYRKKQAPLPSDHDETLLMLEIRRSINETPTRDALLARTGAEAREWFGLACLAWNRTVAARALALERGP